MEACASAHHWGRLCQLLGHEVRLISPQFVKPFVKFNKNDRNDARAIYEAAQRPDMHFVPVKTVEQQAVLSLHRVREMLISQRTTTINQLRGLLTEFGLIASIGCKALHNTTPALLEDLMKISPTFLVSCIKQQWEHPGELNRLGISGDKMIREEEMKNQISYSSEVRERAVRLVFEQQKEHGSQWPATKSIASKIGCTADRKSTRLNSSHLKLSRMPSSA